MCRHQHPTARGSVIQWGSDGSLWSALLSAQGRFCLA